MHKLEIKDFSFTYPMQNNPVFEHVNLSVNQGDFVLVCGRSGLGKTTLLRCIKKEVRPKGKTEGEILLDNQLVETISSFDSASKIGYVFQSPENQIVSDSVFHELAFGLENLGVNTEKIRRRVAETSDFFGITEWSDQKVSNLSGGQKQLLNLASVVIMNPELILLDEPLSQLDPISVKVFLNMLKRLNTELGMTVVISEHALDDVLAISDYVFSFDIDCRKLTREEFVDTVISKNLYNKDSLHAGAVIAGNLGMNIYPFTVRESKKILLENGYSFTGITDEKKTMDDNLIKLKDVWFRYSKNYGYVLKDINISVTRNAVHAVVGGNGSGKSTLLKILAGLVKPSRGKAISIGDKRIALLMQDPKSLLVCDTVYAELHEFQKQFGYSEQSVNYYCKMFALDSLLSRHPYDISGGEMQKLAVVKVLLTDPDVILMDEPTKGMDIQYKKELSNILKELKSCGKTIVFASHDLDFVAANADVCSFVFNGEIVCTEQCREFLSGNDFYTTVTNKIFREIMPEYILPEDVCVEKQSI